MNTNNIIGLDKRKQKHLSGDSNANFL